MAPGLFVLYKSTGKVYNSGENKKNAERRRAKEMCVMQEVYRFLKEAGTYYLATVEGQQPRVRPFGTVNIFEGRLYIQTGKRKDVARQIAENPRVEICAFRDGTWLRLSGELVEDERIQAKAAMLDAYPDLRAMYDENDDNTEVLYFKNATAVFSSFTAPPRTITF